MLLRPLDAEVLSLLWGGEQEEDDRGDPWFSPSLQECSCLRGMTCISEIHSKHSKFHLYIHMLWAVLDPSQRGQKI